MYNKEFDRRKFNTPPPNSSPKRYNKTVSARIEASLLDELQVLLNRRYGGKNVPMAKLSFILRAAIQKKVRELREWER